jgi:hypothetical protein
MSMTASQVSVGNSDTTLFTAASTPTQVLIAATLLNDDHPLYITLYRAGSVVNHAILTSKNLVEFNNIQQNDEVHTINLYGYVLVDVIAAS